jgi:hypothetical protein
MAGTALAYDPPVLLRHYSPSRGTVALRFHNPEYASLMLAAMKEREKATRTGEPS